MDASRRAMHFSKRMSCRPALSARSTSMLCASRKRPLPNTRHLARLAMPAKPPVSLHHHFFLVGAQAVEIDVGRGKADARSASPRLPSPPSGAAGPWTECSRH